MPRGATRRSPTSLARSASPRPPERIECYDMSNIQGTSRGRLDGRLHRRQARAARVPALPDPVGRHARRLPDDGRGPAPSVQPRREAACRRPAPCPWRPSAPTRRRRGSARTASRSTSSRMPDRSTTEPPRSARARAGLGGARPRDRRRRQGPALGGGRGAHRELGITDVPLTGLAKRFEELYLPGRSAPVVLPRRSQALYLVQRIRDEAHRFAITYHRDVRGKRALRSELDDDRRHRPGPEEGAAEALRVGAADPRGVGRRGRRDARHQPRPGRAAQGAPRPRGDARLAGWPLRHRPAKLAILCAARR